MKTIRHSLGLSVVELGRAIGYEGNDNTVSTTIRRYEAPNGRTIPPWIARLVWLMYEYGVPEEWLG